MKRNIKNYCEIALELAPDNIGMTIDELKDLLGNRARDKQDFTYSEALDLACNAFNFGLAVGYKHGLKKGGE